MLVWEISWLHLRMGNVIKALTMQQAKRVIRSELARTAGVFQFCAQANEPFRVRDLSGQGVLNLAGGAIVMRADYLPGAVEPKAVRTARKSGVDEARVDLESE